MVYLFIKTEKTLVHVYSYFIHFFVGLMSLLTNAFGLLDTRHEV
jgi:hypothetical protein